MSVRTLCTAGLTAAAITAPAAHSQTTVDAQASMQGRDGKELGTVKLVNTPHGVLLSLQLHGLPAGVHGVHIHETGRCDAAGGFESAGGHFNPDGREHGFTRAGGPHAGDMTNQAVGQNGTLIVDIFNSLVTLSSGKHSLLDGDSSAIMIHSGADDYSSQPSGSAGDRLACGVIQRP